MNPNPYEQLPERAFWKPSVANRSMFDIEGLWDPRFEIQPKHKVVTYGSCFAQHIGRSLQARGFNWYITEKAPFGLSDENKKRFSYDIFSSRTGNIYTTSLLRQWTSWALGHAPVPDETWQAEHRSYDPFRPVAEPDGFDNADEVARSRKETVAAFGRSIRSADFFVFTLGLTESWVHDRKGHEYPMCPGTAAGEFDKAVHQFRNQDFLTILENLRESMRLMRAVNPELRFILTVSPVPLTATMSGDHVLVATMASKSILRAVASQLISEDPAVDYFPSYEIINSPVFRGTFFEPNQRSVNPRGVEFVMDMFFNCLASKFGESKPRKSKRHAKTSDEMCEEELLAAFNPKK